MKIDEFFEQPSMSSLCQSLANNYYQFQTRQESGNFLGRDQNQSEAVLVVINKRWEKTTTTTTTTLTTEQRRRRLKKRRHCSLIFWSLNRGTVVAVHSLPQNMPIRKISSQQGVHNIQMMAIVLLLLHHLLVLLLQYIIVQSR